MAHSESGLAVRDAAPLRRSSAPEAPGDHSVTPSGVIPPDSGLCLLELYARLRLQQVLRADDAAMLARADAAERAPRHPDGPSGLEGRVRLPAGPAAPSIDLLSRAPRAFIYFRARFACG